MKQVNADSLSEQSYPKREAPKHATKYASEILQHNNIDSKPDAELSRLIGLASVHLQDEDLSRFLQEQKKFDRPMNIREELIPHYNLQQSLNEIPGFMDAAENAELTYEQVIDILTHTLNADPYDFHKENIHIILLTRIFNVTAETNNPLSPHIDPFRKMISITAKNGSLDASLHAFKTAIKIGLSIDQTLKLIFKLNENTGAFSPYAVNNFIKALKSILPATVNPDLAFQTFEFLAGNDPVGRQKYYQYFETLMTFGVPSRHITPNELLALFLTKAKQGHQELSMLEAHDLAQQSPEAIHTPKDQHFIQNDKIEHATLPYQVSKPLNEGIRDLEKLAIANSELWEDIGEGMWVFSPENQTWYSLGGTTDALSTPGKVIHNFIPYDISHLSDTPYLFHIHPEEYSQLLSPPREIMAHPELQKNITQFFTATPSGKDYGTIGEFLQESNTQVSTHSFIVHALGVTEFIYPNDPNKLEEMRAQSKNLRDQVLMEFNVTSYLRYHRFSINNFHLVEKLIEALNTKLPDGFGIKLHPLGTDFENTKEVTGLRESITNLIKQALKLFRPK